MTRDEVLAWLQTRKPAPPESLRERLVKAVHDQRPAPGSRLPSYLAQLGANLLDGVVGKPDGGRELAMDLLAADAFATYAFEAQTEQGKEAVDET